MKYSSSAISLTLGLILLVFLGLFLVVDPQREKEKSIENVVNLEYIADFSEEYNRWKGRIEEIGAENAYQEFKEYTLTKPYLYQHPLAHIFGEALYDTKGEERMAVCDHTMQFGCFHGFLGKSLLEEGINSLPSLAQSCQAMPNRHQEGGCEHGLGHGILANLGFTNLSEALELCHKIFGERKACAGGVFMEYNFPSLAHQGRVLARNFDPKNPHAPCSQLSSDLFETWCYRSQPMWWAYIFERAHGRVAELCGEIERADAREFCFAGIGEQLVFSTDNNLQEITDVCKALPAKEGEAACREEAAIIGFLSFEDRQTSLALCQNLPLDVQENCLARLQSSPLWKDGSLKNQRTELPSDLLQERAYWAARIDKIGAEKAWDEFTWEYEPLGATAHVAAHMFGEALYNAEGPGGVTVCDESFSYGCYHPLFIKAFQEYGMGVLHRFDEACIAKNGPGGQGCQHGIGHGLLYYLGSDKLLEALEACTLLAWDKPFFGCQSGAIMEYHHPSLFESETVLQSLRPMENDNPYHPCPSLPERFRQACYYELPRWWRAHTFTYKEIGDFCESVSNQEEKEACYLGTGLMAVLSSGFQSDKTVSLCQEMSSAEGEILCRAGASWAYRGSQNQTPAGTVCEQELNPEEQSLCQEKAIISKKWR